MAGGGGGRRIIYYFKIIIVFLTAGVANTSAYGIRTRHGREKQEQAEAHIQSLQWAVGTVAAGGGGHISEGQQVLCSYSHSPTQNGGHGLARAVRSSG